MELRYGRGNNDNVIYHTRGWSRQRLNKQNIKVTFTCTVTMFLVFFNEFGQKWAPKRHEVNRLYLTIVMACFFYGADSI
jgi:hypothetical protein